MMAATLEYVHLTVKNGAEEEFLRLRPAVEQALAGMPGFRDAELVRLDDGSWLDLVHWDSHQAALAAAEKVMQMAEVAPWMQLIDEVKVMTHGQVRARTGDRVA
jgi:hypothetical protein